MKLTVLGMNGPFSAPGGACSGYLLSDDREEHHLLLDCGPGVMGRLFAHLPVEALTAVLLSHLHYDHMSDLMAMRYAVDFSARAQNLPVYLPDEPAHVRRLLTGGRFDLLPIEDQSIGPFTVTFLPARHPVTAYSMRIACDGAALVYTGDTNAHSALNLFADGCDLLLADSCLPHARWTAAAPHLSARLCGELARDARAGQLVLTHLSPLFDAQALLGEARAVYPTAALAALDAVFYA